MLKFVKIITVILLAFPAVYFSACSSGEYDIKEYQVDYTEKTVKTDTIKKVVLKEDSIKLDKNNKNNIQDNTKESYSYTIQIGAFAMQSNVERFMEIAKLSIGEGVYSEDSGNLYKIRVGKFTTRAEAIKFAEFVKTKGYFDAFVITKKN